ncbi:NifB/NifX family molybdenum-iron cluster-binding protein [Cellulosilyticum ruminicola]|uniref:NifB/NifX family molybdenum-iron cluster-binding protein n=1 Tax=Cellulosilyticum ruminicola TaxID=425254 RepID=UPI0006D120B1|nr:NifB/NifX family molybdenum-iron cluster-binding protein [Cellulosilyticum ruminicola]
MAYKVAVGSSNGEMVDLKFGEASKFMIYEVDGEQFKLHEMRQVLTNPVSKEGLDSIACSKNECGKNGCAGNGRGCNGASDVVEKVTLIEDCRCVVCQKVGFQAQKQLERKAISVFDVTCLVSEALSKIAYYYNKLDRHESLRKK